MKKPEIKEILKSFNEDMNAELGNVSTADYKGKTIPGSERPVTPADYIEFYQDEWQKTVEKLAEAGLDLEEEGAETVKGMTINVSVKDMEFFKVLSQALTQIYVATEEENTKEIIEETLKRIGVGKEEEMIKKENKTEIKVKTRIPYIAFIKDDALGKVIEEIRKIEKEHSCNCTLLDVEIN